MFKFIMSLLLGASLLTTTGCRIYINEDEVEDELVEEAPEVENEDGLDLDLEDNEVEDEELDADVEIEDEEENVEVENNEEELNEEDGE